MVGAQTPPCIMCCPPETLGYTPLHATNCMWLLAALTSSSSTVCPYGSGGMYLCPFPQRPHRTSTSTCRPTASTACCTVKSQHTSMPLTPLSGPPLLRLLLLPAAPHRIPAACAACAVPAAPGAHGLAGSAGAAGDGDLPTPPSRPAATGARAGAAQQCACCCGWQGQQQCWECGWVAS